jgi:hypothetical protein
LARTAKLSPMTRYDLVRALEAVATRLKEREPDEALRVAAEVGLEGASLVALGPGFNLRRSRSEIMSDIFEVALLRGEVSGIGGRAAVQARRELLERAFEQELPLT